MCRFSERELRQAVLEAIPLQPMSPSTGAIRKNPALKIYIPDTTSEPEDLEDSSLKQMRVGRNRVISMVGDNEEHRSHHDRENQTPYQNGCPANSKESVYLVMPDEPKVLHEAASRHLSLSSEENQEKSVEAGASTNNDDAVISLTDDVDGDWNHSIEKEAESFVIPESNTKMTTTFAVIFSIVVIGSVIFTAIAVWGPAIRNLIQPK